MARTFFLVVLAMTLVVKSGSAIKCYQCNSVLDTRCADQVDKKYLAGVETDCSNSFGTDFLNSFQSVASALSKLGLSGNSISSNTEMACYKTKKSGEVLRFCSVGGSNNICDDLKGFDCNKCESNLCNSGTHFSKLPTMIYALVPCILILIGLQFQFH